MTRTKVEVDPVVHDLAKVRAKACRMTLKAWVEALIEAELERPLAVWKERKAVAK
jgi:predicted HicB family RNase H-like nuclease